MTVGRAPVAMPMPPATCATKAATQSPIRPIVTGAAPADARTERGGRGCFWRAHSGQRIPTGVDVMQSGQIGLPQLEQATFVSLPGCR